MQTKMVLMDETNTGGVVITLECDKYTRCEVWYKGSMWLALGYVMGDKTVPCSSCLKGFEDSKHIVDLMQEAFSIFDSQPNVDTLKMLGYKCINQPEHLLFK